MGEEKCWPWICTIKERIKFTLWVTSHKPVCINLCPDTFLPLIRSSIVLVKQQGYIMSFMTHDDSQMFRELCCPVEQMGVYNKVSIKFSKIEDQVIS